MRSSTNSCQWPSLPSESIIKALEWISFILLYSGMRAHLMTDVSPNYNAFNTHRINVWICSHLVKINLIKIIRRGERKDLITSKNNFFSVTKLLIFCLTILIRDHLPQKIFLKLLNPWIWKGSISLSGHILQPSVIICCTSHILRWCSKEFLYTSVQCWNRIS